MNPDADAPRSADTPPPSGAPGDVPEPAVKAKSAKAVRTARSATAPRARTLLAVWSLQMLLVLALGLPLALIAAAAAALHSATATGWLLKAIPGLTVDEPQGALLGPRFATRRLVWNLPAGDRLEIDDLAWDGARWRWWISARVWAQADLATLSAQRVQWRSRAVPTATAPAPPTAAAWPMTWRVERFDVPQLQIDDQKLSALSGTLHLGAEDGSVHRLDAASLRWGRVQAEGSLQLKAVDLGLASAWRITPLAPASPPEGASAPRDVLNDWEAGLEVEGTLAAIDLRATLRARHGQAQTVDTPRPGRSASVDTPGTPKASKTQGDARISARTQARMDAKGDIQADAPAPSLDARLTLRPFQPWPLGDIALSLQALDLSALAEGWPRTRLAGRAEVRSAGVQQPLQADIDLTNGLSARWQDGGVPLRRARLTLSALPGRIDEVGWNRAEIELGTAAGPAGTVRGRGSWSARALSLDMDLATVRIQPLHALAPDLTLSGPLKADITGLAGPGAADLAKGPLTLALKGDLKGELGRSVEGRLAGSRPMITAAIDTVIGASRIDLGRLDLRAGATRVSTAGQARRQADGRWQTATTGEVAALDPLAWLPPSTAVDPAWRQARHDLNGRWQLDLTHPVNAWRLPALQWLQSLQGSGQLHVDASTLAGVPVQGRIEFGQDPKAPPARRSTIDGEWMLASNRLALQGRADPLGPGTEDRWRFELDAPAIARLAPWMALLPSTRSWVPLAGAAEATLQAQGRWPRLVSDGRLSITGARTAALQLDDAQVRWRADSVVAENGDLAAELHGLTMDGERLDRLSLRLDGSFQSHTASLWLQAPVAPPRWVGTVLGMPSLAAALPARAGASGNSGNSGEHGQAGTRAELRLRGGWASSSGGGGRWRGTVDRLRALPASASQATASFSGAGDPTIEPWFDAQGFEGWIDVDPQGRIGSAAVQAGQATLAGEARLRWSALDYRRQAGRHDLEAAFEIDPIPVAPLLTRLGTGLDWGGDLRVGLRGRVQAARTLQAELEFGRAGGDLVFVEAGVPRPLGLSQAGISLRVNQGVWRFTPLLVGETLGVVSGALELKTEPTARWPAAQDRLSGAVRAEVRDLSIWSAWVPPGWGLAGQLATTARLGGRFGAPEFTGELEASRVVVRNLLEGVALTDGDLHVTLQGTQARIDRARIAAGQGTLDLSGDIDLGARPQARLRYDAKAFQLLGRIDRQLVVQGQGSLDLTPQRFELRGRIGVDQGLFDLGFQDAPALDGDVVVIGEGGAGQTQGSDRSDRSDRADRTEPREQAAPPASASATRRPSDAGPDPSAPMTGWMRRSTVDLALDLGNKLRVRGRGIDTGLGGTLKLGSAQGRLRIDGTVQALQGTYRAYGQKLEIERGLLQFTGEADNPRLDILALRPQTDVRVGVAITGTARIPRIRLYSEPELTEQDKLAWLVLGRSAEGLGRTDTTVLQRAALALLTGEQEAPTDALLRSLGIDDLAISQTEGDVRETVVTLGKQLGRNWYVGYERSVNATQGTWQLVYRLAQSFTLRAHSGLDKSLDLVWTWRFDRPRQAQQDEPEKPAGVGDRPTVP